MPVLAFIDGVLVSREETHEFSSKDRPFSYHRYSFPATALRPGAFSPLLRILPGILEIRILHTDTTRHIDVNITTFLEYWLYLSEDLAGPPAHWAGHIVLFRDDLKPLYPKQLEVLWRFCDRLFMVLTAPCVGESLPWEFRCVFFWLQAIRHRDPEAIGLTTDSDHEFKKLMEMVKQIWEDYCTIDNFNAFFELYRRGRLLHGDPDWRDSKSPCDV